MLSIWRHPQPAYPTIYRVKAFTLSFVPDNGGWMKLSDIVDYSGQNVREVWNLALKLSNSPSLIPLAVPQEKDVYIYVDISSTGAVMYLKDTAVTWLHQDYAIDFDILVEKGALLVAGLGKAILDELHQQKTGCWHQQVCTEEWMVACSGDFCSNLGHDCGPHHHVRCLRCGEVVNSD